jgi:hypothetical protein
MVWEELEHNIVLINRKHKRLIELDVEVLEKCSMDIEGKFICNAIYGLIVQNRVSYVI